ncbi:hypothetical protein ABT075_43765 [Streptomyces sp. NPDC002677]|uniref:hypothetical protein n=1 Tax=Streptomyces sp. NPDC002677 TaxID=3154774 RepID=UPI00331B1DE0
MTADCGSPDVVQAERAPAYDVPNVCAATRSCRFVPSGAVTGTGIPEGAVTVTGLPTR